MPPIKFAACSDSCKYSQKFKESHVKELTYTLSLHNDLDEHFPQLCSDFATLLNRKDIIDSTRYYLNRSRQQFPLRNDQCMSRYIC